VKKKKIAAEMGIFACGARNFLGPGESDLRFFVGSSSSRDCSNSLADCKDDYSVKKSSFKISPRDDSVLVRWEIRIFAVGQDGRQVGYNLNVKIQSGPLVSAKPSRTKLPR
jgi:hypothetical protein